MRRYEQKVVLKVRTDHGRLLRKKEMDFLASCLNSRFADAEFELEPLPEIAWHPKLMTIGSQRLYDKLITAKDWYSFRNINSGRVAMCRFKKELPPHLKVIVKRGCGYKLIDLRKNSNEN
jgi:hypothetical protein